VRVDDEYVHYESSATIQPGQDRPSEPIFTMDPASSTNTRVRLLFMTRIVKEPKMNNQWYNFTGPMHEILADASIALVKEAAESNAPGYKYLRKDGGGRKALLHYACGMADLLLLIASGKVRDFQFTDAEDGNSAD